MAMQLPPLREVERLSARVIRILGGNPGKFTLQGTNTYLIGQGPQRLLIDTGEGLPSWIRALTAVLSSEHATITSTLLTHWHPDHINGVPDLLHTCPSTQLYKHQPHYHAPVFPTAPRILDIAHGQIFKVEGATLRALHCPGHTADHMAFVLEEEDALFTGDNVLGHGTAVFEDLAAYMSSLRRMEGEFKGRAYPGHGEVVGEGRGKVREYVEHRLEREREVLGVLEGVGKEEGGGKKKEGWSPMEVVKVVYRAYPEELHGPAQGSVRHVLRKLEGEGKVLEDGESGRWRVVSKSAL